MAYLEMSFYKKALKKYSKGFRRKSVAWRATRSLKWPASVVLHRGENTVGRMNPMRSHMGLVNKIPFDRTKSLTKPKKTSGEQTSTRIDLLPISSN